MQQVTQEDLAELSSLIAQAKRPIVIEALKKQEAAWEQALNEREKEKQATPAPVPTPEPLPAPIAKGAATMTINYIEPTDYYWEENNNAVTITLPIPGVHDLPAEKITSSFGAKEVTITIHGNKNYKKVFRELYEPIIPGESSHILRKDKVLLSLKKKNKREWGNLLASKRNQKIKKPDVSDPDTGLMDLMRNVYEEGDEEMKRNIAKAWSESRNKSKDTSFSGLGGTDW